MTTPAEHPSTAASDAAHGESPEVTCGTAGLDGAALAGVLRRMYDNYLAEHPDADLRSEFGWHRLVWLSPFDTQARRQTVWVYVGDGTSDEQVRSYILHPYTRAHNHGDSREVADVHSVLSGRLLGELL